LGKPFSIIAKPIGPICNIDCKYCFYLDKEKLYPEEKSWKMSDAMLENYIRQYIESQPAGLVQFLWQGGEPALLGLSFYEKALELQNKYSNGKYIENAFQTNGILLDDEWCKFFADHDFLVGISIDGPKQLHDYYRVNKKGKSTFDLVLRGIDYLKKHTVRFNTLTVVNRKNSYYPLEVYEFLKEIGSEFMQFIPAVEKKNIEGITIGSTVDLQNLNSIVSDWSVEPDQYGNFLCEIFDSWVKKDVGQYFVQSFDVALESWCGVPPSLCVVAETCGNALAIEHNGDLFSCDHYVFPENLLGNISVVSIGLLAVSEQQEKFGRDKKEKLPGYCLKCEYKFACNGGCPKERFITTPEGEAGLNYLCSGYKKFFEHIGPYMKFMVNELNQKQPPSNVMNLFRTEEIWQNFTRKND